MTVMIQEQQRTYTFDLQTKPGSNPQIAYSYPILVRSEPDWDEFGALLSKLHADHFTLVADAGLPLELVQAVYDHLQALQVPCLLLTLPANEQQKTMEMATLIYQQARANGGATHASCFLALGGGVIGNIVGLAASLVVRGIAFVSIPTTVLAGTDSILSCKQGVNAEIEPGLLVKNLVGTFRAPVFVLIYTSFWRSLPHDEIRSGLCELIKNVVAIRPDLYASVYDVLNPDARYSTEQYAQIIQWSIQAKHKVMQEDAHEQGNALILELGHGIGHALEAYMGVRHGFAVGLGLLASAHIAYMRGSLTKEDLLKHYLLLAKNGAPTRLSPLVSIDALVERLGNDNKRGYLPVRPGHFLMVLLKAFGQPVVSDGLPLCIVTEQEVRAGIQAIQQESPLGYDREFPGRFV